MQASGGMFCPLTGAERKSAVRSQTDAIDPELTSTAKEVGQINALHINSGQYITAGARWHS